MSTILILDDEYAYEKIGSTSDGYWRFVDDSEQYVGSIYKDENKVMFDVGVPI